jgi:Zn finger protein HypA/HybF involved in hydrogenase expression
MPPSSTCSICDAARELFRGRNLVRGYEVRECVCPKCSSSMQIVMKGEGAPGLSRREHDHFTSSFFYES